MLDQGSLAQVRTHGEAVVRQPIWMCLWGGLCCITGPSPDSWAGQALRHGFCRCRQRQRSPSERWTFKNRCLRLFHLFLCPAQCRWNLAPVFVSSRFWGRRLNSWVSRRSFRRAMALRTADSVRQRLREAAPKLPALAVATKTSIPLRRPNSRMSYPSGLFAWVWIRPYGA